MPIKLFNVFTAIGLAFALNTAWAQQDTVVYVDLGLDPSELQNAVKLVSTLAESASPRDRLGLVGADETVRHVTELAPARDFLGGFEQFRAQLNSLEFSNYAIGLERSVDMLKNSVNDKRIVLIGGGAVQTGDIESNNRYAQWGELVLIPDASFNAIQLIFVKSRLSGGEETATAISSASADNQVHELPRDTLSTVALGRELNGIITLAQNNPITNQTESLAPSTAAGEPSVSTSDFQNSSIASQEPTVPEPELKPGVSSTETVTTEAVVEPVVPDGVDDGKNLDEPDFIESAEQGTAVVTAKIPENASTAADTVDAAPVSSITEDVRPQIHLTVQQESDTTSQPEVGQKLPENTLVIALLALVGVLMAAVSWFALSRKRKDNAANTRNRPDPVVDWEGRPTQEENRTLVNDVSPSGRRPVVANVEENTSGVDYHSDWREAATVVLPKNSSPVQQSPERDAVRNSAGLNNEKMPADRQEDDWYKDLADVNSSIEDEFAVFEQSIRTKKSRSQEEAD